MALGFGKSGTYPEDVFGTEQKSASLGFLFVSSCFIRFHVVSVCFWALSPCLKIDEKHIFLATWFCWFPSALAMAKVGTVEAINLSEATSFDRQHCDKSHDPPSEGSPRIRAFKSHSVFNDIVTF